MATTGRAERRERAREALGAYANGHAAPVRATADALARAGGATTIVLVEGISDQIAVETAAAGRGLDLQALQAAVVPIGGAHAIGRFLTTFDPARVRLVGLCDRREADLFHRALPADGQVFVCVDDLEDELIRAVGTARVEELLAARGDLRPFRTLQTQPAWRDQHPDAQLRRFFGSGARRKSRYARVLVEAARDALPDPLEALLTTLTRR